jgi:hypothetical protein
LFDGIIKARQAEDRREEDALQILMHLYLTNNISLLAEKVRQGFSANEPEFLYILHPQDILRIMLEIPIIFIGIV